MHISPKYAIFTSKHTHTSRVTVSVPNWDSFNAWLWVEKFKFGQGAHPWKKRKMCVSLFQCIIFGLGFSCWFFFE